MILQSLVSYYEGLMARGELPPAGWSIENVSYMLELNADGGIKDIVSLKLPKGEKMVPQKMLVPSRIGRSGKKMASNFMCDNAKYFLGYDKKDLKRAKECFQTAVQFHTELLAGINDEAVTALLKFFKQWDVEHVCEHVQQYNEQLLKEGNMIFSYHGTYMQDLPVIRKAWQTYLPKIGDEQQGRCMVTGEDDFIAVLHPHIKGIGGAKQQAAPLVTFNKESFCSFGKKQGMNAPIGEYAANAYGEALKHLIEKMSFQQYMGDTAVLCYALDGNDQYGSAFDEFLFGAEGTYTEQDLNDMVIQLCEGKCIAYNQEQLDPSMQFYILGIGPNNGRLLVRFFFAGTFGMFVKNIQCHQERLEIDRLHGNSKTNISIKRILKETYKHDKKNSSQDEKKSDNKEKSTLILERELSRAILNNANYPVTLINAIDARIRVDHKINDVRAAIIKAYYLKNQNVDVPKEVLTMGLNTQTDNIAYNLGRLFAVLEKIQQVANPEISTTINDRFFRSASAMPAMTFPNLINLAKKHLRKIDDGLQIYYEKQIGEIMDKFDDFPLTLNMPQRGVFQLGYYHQVQELYKKTQKKEAE